MQRVSWGEPQAWRSTGEACGRGAPAAASACCTLCCRSACATADRSSVMRRCRRGAGGGHDGCARETQSSSMGAGGLADVAHNLVHTLSPRGWGSCAEHCRRHAAALCWAPGPQLRQLDATRAACLYSPSKTRGDSLNRNWAALDSRLKASVNAIKSSVVCWVQQAACMSHEVSCLAGGVLPSWPHTAIHRLSSWLPGLLVAATFCPLLRASAAACRARASAGEGEHSVAGVTRGELQGRTAASSLPDFFVQRRA